MESFAKLGLSQPILRAIEELGFKTPSAIQEQAIPLLTIENIDFLGLAQTGTGKTAAFGLPLLERINPNEGHTQGLILAPTRELGQQIAGQLELFSKFQDRVNMLAVYGGAPIGPQIRALKRPQHIIIATPGRLIDLIERRAVKLQDLEYLILDEADEMLNMGFKQELDTILSYTPEEKLVWLFSATMSREVRRIVQTYMEDPLEIKIDAKQRVNADISHQFVMLRQADKTEALTRFLDRDRNMRGIVFCRTKRDTQGLADLLQSQGYKVDALHGDLTQKHRDRVMKAFKEHTLEVIIATDVAARGIDVNDLTHVIHYNLPDDPAYYTHRSGRTGRAGNKGISLSLVNGREKGKLNRLANELRIKVEQVPAPSTDEIDAARMEAWCLEVLEQRAKGKIHPAIQDRAETLFGNLSKQELIAKLLMMELRKLNIDRSLDVNARAEPKRSSHRGGGGRGRRKSYPSASGGGKKSIKRADARAKKRNFKKKKKKKF